MVGGTSFFASTGWHCKSAGIAVRVVAGCMNAEAGSAPESGRSDW